MPYKNIVFVKLEKRLFNDPRWYMMSDAAQLNYIRLILFAAETYNKIPCNLGAIRRAFKTTQPSARLLRSLKEIQKNFPKLKCNKEFYYFEDFEQKTNYRPEEILGKPQGNPKEGVDIEKDLYKDNKSKTETKAPIDFIQSLKDNQAYKHIDIDVELGKMDAWLSTKPGRKKTKQFVLNWLNRIEKPLGPTTKPSSLKTVKCSVPGCKEKAEIPTVLYSAHREVCEGRFRSENTGPMDPEVRKLINVACGRKPEDDGQ